MSLENDHIKFIEKYKKDQKVNRNKTILKLFFALSLMFFMMFVSYYKWIDELKFIGKETTFVTAKIINEKRVHVGEGLYIQSGNCKFEFDKKEYVAGFKTKEWRRVTNPKEFEIGDFIKLKILVNDPLISKFIE